MPRFIVNYDLIKTKDYQKLIVELERLDGVRALESCWLIELANTTEQVRDHFKSFIDADDWLMVVEFNTRPRWTFIRKAAADWVDAHFP